MASVTNQDLQALFDAVGSSNISDDARQELFKRLAFSEEELKASIREEIREEVIKEIHDEYELDADNGVEAAVVVESDLFTTIGVGPNKRDVNIRYLHIGDFENMVSLVPDVTRLLFKKGPSFVKGKTAMQFFEQAINAFFGKKSVDSKLKRRAYEILAECLTNRSTDQVVTYADLRGCRPGQIKKVIQDLYSVNTDFFHELWLEFPGPMRTLISMTIGTLTTSINEFVLKSWDFVESMNGLVGTTHSGGTTNGSTQSPPNTDSQTMKFEDSTSSEPIGIENPSEEGSTGPVTSPGRTRKTSKTVKTVVVQAQEVAD